MTPLVALLLAAQQQPAPDVAASMAQAVKTFAQAFAIVESEAADKVTPDQAIYGGALPGMLRGLDPHSIFLDPDQFEQLKEMNNAEQKGFGSIVSILPGRVIVLQTMPGTPSAKSGLSPGDEIVGVNNIPLMSLEAEQIVQLLSQSRRQPAAIRVRRANTPRLLEFTLIPENFASPSVDRVYQLRPGIGYVRISSFESKTADEARKAIEDLGGAALKGLILDLRNNPGGAVEPALATAALFLKPGARILSVRGRKKQQDDVTVPDGTTPYEVPVAVLINEKTASAAEIVSAALQDNGRALVAGQRSFGKGLVQSVFPLTNNTGVALTVAFYYSPKGRNIQRPLKDVQLAAETSEADRGGVTPNLAVNPDGFTRLRAVLDASGSFATFATEVLREGLKVDEQFRPDGALLDRFQAWLARRNIQPGVSEWTADLTWIRSRLRQEIFNQSLGVAKGDEVEAERDPQIQRAADAIAK